MKIKHSTAEAAAGAAAAQLRPGGYSTHPHSHKTVSVNGNSRQEPLGNIYTLYRPATQSPPPKMKAALLVSPADGRVALVGGKLFLSPSHALNVGGVQGCVAADPDC